APYVVNGETWALAFVTRLNAQGGLAYSTYLGRVHLQGGINEYQIGNAITVDNQGNAYVAGQTGITPYAIADGMPYDYDHFFDAFLAQIGTSGGGNWVHWNIGGIGDPNRGGGTDAARGIARGPTGELYVSGVTDSVDFPVTGGALQPALHLDPSGFVTQDGFVLRLTAGG